MPEQEPQSARPVVDPRPKGTGSGLDALLDSALDPLFGTPSFVGGGQNWEFHLPVLGWLVSGARPSVLVELGTGIGASYAACCDEVARSNLSTRCNAVCSPGEAGADGFPDRFRQLHDRSYSGFSRLITASPEDAAARFPPGSIDLLVVDAEADPGWAGDEGRSRLLLWAPRLSSRCILIMHGIASAGAAGWSGVWRQLRQTHPFFEFHQGVGLGVAAVGPQVPSGLRALFALGEDSPDAARLRARMARLGERWRADQMVRAGERERNRLAAVHHDSLGQARESLRVLSIAHDRLRDELAFAKADRYRLEQEAARILALWQDENKARAREQQEADARADQRAALLVEEMSARLERSRAIDRATMQDLARTHASERTAAARALADAQIMAAELQAFVPRAIVALQARDKVLGILQNSLSWRMTRPLRLVRGLLSGRPRAFAQGPAELSLGLPTVSLPAASAMPSTGDGPDRAIEAEARSSPELPWANEPDGAPETPSVAEPSVALQLQEPQMPRVAVPPGTSTWRPIRRILFVAGEPGTPGAAYRTARNAAACRAAGFEAECVDIAGVDPDNLAAADLVVLWRAGFSAHVQTMLELAAHARTRVAFDVDDLIVQPSLAVAEIIDGIRTTFVTEAESRAYFQSMQRTMLNCDLCTTTTRELAAAMGQLHPMVHLLPNSFDLSVERASRRAVRLRGEMAEDGLVRLGYAGGTRTHQKDFAQIAPVLAAVLAQREQARLVLFRDPRSGEGLVLVEEFPELVPFSDRIEWRDLVPLPELPAELARFDISLCPLEQDNPFCEAKSELKYFESALAGVCLVATPTGPFRRAVQDGVTGFLPTDAAGWTATLLRLVDDRALRRRVARSAGHDVLWRFGPRRQAELWALLLAELDGGVRGARAADLALRRGGHMAAGLPDVPEGSVLFSHDRLGEAQVTVGMTSYNYESHIGEALDSVLAQTLQWIDLVVVDDGSTDGSVALLLDWAECNRTRFNRLRILRTETNAGLGGARNLVFDQAEAPWIMVLDSDNRLAPTACETLLRAAEADGLAAFSYPRIRQFGGADGVMGADDFQPARLAAGNYIDAMALVAKWAWAAAGGYYVRRDAMGWEDFSLWCRLVELGLHGVPVAEELAFYRVHGGSMVNAITEQSDNKQLMVAFVESRHRWLRLRMRASRKRLDRPSAG